MTRRNVLLQKENNCKFQLRFVKCCTLVVTEGYHILLSLLNRLSKLKPTFIFSNPANPANPSSYFFQNLANPAKPGS